MAEINPPYLSVSVNNTEDGSHLFEFPWPGDPMFTNKVGGLTQEQFLTKLKELFEETPGVSVTVQQIELVGTDITPSGS